MMENCHGAFKALTEREEENRPPNEATLRGFMTMADACVMMWHRVGGRNFTYQDVKDLLTSPAQLLGMENRGYVTIITGPTRRGENYTGKIYKLTDQVKNLAQVREGMFR